MNFAPQASNQPMQFPQSIVDVGNALDNKVNDISQSVKSSMDGFSQQVDVNSGASSTFLDSNTIVAKFAFIILVVIVFLFMLNLGITFLSNYFSPPNNPYVMSGASDGNEAVSVSQDPKLIDSVLIKRSNNEKDGLEFTWSVWIYIKELPNDANKHHIFNKGNDEFDEIGKATINNCPGLYLEKDNLSAKLNVILNTTTNASGSVGEESMSITDIPIRKWVNVIIRCKNTMIDVYINGTITKRLNLNGAPIQNYNDVHIGKNGGFKGNISNLMYYSKATDIFTINQIVSSGPDLTPSQMSNTGSLPNNYKFLSNSWYSNKI